MADLGLRKRRPRGWVDATARARSHRTYDPPRGHDPEGGETVIDPRDAQRLMDVEWEVSVPGRGAFTVQETGRKVPLWVDPWSPALGRGRRFWSVRVRPTHGLSPEVLLPCLVPPDRVDEVWIDWDAAYDLHLPVWDRASAVDHATTVRRGGIDGLAARALSPLRPRLDPADAYLVEERLAAERAEWDAAVAATDAAARAGHDPSVEEYLARNARITSTGRRTSATIVSATPTGGQLHGLPEWAIALDLDEGGAVRRIVHHEPLGRATPPWTPGLATIVFVDPDAPDEVAFGA